MPIGETLVGKGLITNEQLKRALEEQKKDPGKKLGELLVQLGYIDGSVLSKALG